MSVSISNLEKREKAVALYLATPNICEYCGNVITVAAHQKVTEVRRKRFCNNSCSVRYRNSSISLERVCLECGCPYETPKLRNRRSRSKYCPSCRSIKISRQRKVKRSKQEVFAVSKNWTAARAYISRHARYVYETSGNEKSCAICGYAVHIEICHIHPVHEFPLETSVEEINRLSNLVPLCPNHHWEHDHGMLHIAGREGLEHGSYP